MEHLIKNPILNTDSYKLTHYGMYPQGTEEVYSYFESRRGSQWPYSVFFGLQYMLKTYFIGKVVTKEMIDYADDFCRMHFNDANQFNRKGWEHILKKHNGKLPVEIKAVPEGTVVGESNVIMTIRNTDPECYWLTNHLETMLVQLWHACTVATSSTSQYLKLKEVAEKTGSNMDMLKFKLHDFGFRGATSFESAALGGAGHLIPFAGTDNIAAITLIKQFYSHDKDYMPGFSIPAAEHSTIISHNNEVAAYEHIIKNYPVASIVSDSYDYDNAVENIWGIELYDYVNDRLKAKPVESLLVIRPDSGEPVDNVIWTLETLGKKFGICINPKGYKSLPDGLAVIQGDGIDPKSLGFIVDTMVDQGWTLDSIAFGSGGGLLQKVNRDTQRFAMKASSVTIYGEEWVCSKAPKGDLSKASKAGKMKLVKKNIGFVTVPEEDDGEDIMQTVFKDGYLTNEYSFEDVRRNWENTIKLV